MKNKKKYLFWIMLFVFLLISIFSNKKVSNAIDSNNDLLVTGIVTGTDEMGNKTPLSGVNISIINSDNNSQIATTDTDSNGEYMAKVPSGKYYIKYNYPESATYQTTKVESKMYELYNKNLELGVVYGQAEEDKVNFLNSKFTTDSFEFRLIKNKYSNESDIENQIKALRYDPNSENAFNKMLILENNKGVTLILSNKEATEIQKYVDEHLKGDSGDYNSIILNSSTSISQIIDSILNAKLGLNSSSSEDNISTQDATSCVTKELNILGTMIINVNTNVSKIVNSNLQGDANYPDFISGTIYKNNMPIQKEVKVTLTNVQNNKYIVKTFNNGEYKFAYPGSGDYKLEYEFISIDEVNGQYFEPDNSVPEQNWLKRTNLNEINQKFESIDCNAEKRLDDDNNLEKKLKGESDIFLVPTNEVDIDLNTKKITANVRLKQRKRFSLSVEQNVYQYKILLNNSQIFTQYKYEGDKYYRNLGLFNITLDSKLSYGAKLFVEYEIKVINNSDIDCTGYTLLSRYENLEFNKEQYRLSDIRLMNGDVEYTKIEKSKVTQIIGNNDDTDSMTYLLVNGNNVPAKGSQTHYVTLTRHLDAKDGSAMFRGFSELVEYKNIEGRRNYSSPQQHDNEKENIIRAGNYLPHKSKEVDTSFSEDIAIIPPTGFDIKTFCLLISSTIICIISFKYLTRNNVRRVRYERSKKIEK